MPSQPETAILDLMMGKDSFTVWIRDELAQAGVVFDDALAGRAKLPRVRIC